MIEMTNLSKAIKGNKLCVNYLLTVFYPRNTLTKLKVHKAFILSPGLMYCQVRSCVQMRGENAKTILKSVWKHCRLKTRITQELVNCNFALEIN